MFFLCYSTHARQAQIKKIEDLVNEATNLAINGVKELILIAQDLTYYGLDIYKKRKLASLLLELSKIDQIEWIRIHYAFPTGFPNDVLDVIRNNKKICNYIDIPLQHISDNILKSMKRGTTFEKTNQLLSNFRKKVPGIAIRTTLIVGYPGETEENFEELKKWVSETKFDRLGVFEYSHEENTSAFSLDDNVSAKVKSKRVKEIMDLQSDISYNLNQKKIGKIFKVLFDRKEGNILSVELNTIVQMLIMKFWLNRKMHMLELVILLMLLLKMLIILICMQK